MRKSLKIVVATFQVFIAIIGFNLGRLFPNSQWVYPEASYVKDLVGKLNFPLEAFWTVIFLGVDRLSKYVSKLPNSLLTIGLFVVGLLLVLSIATFWWFVVSEVQSRLCGRSVIRRSRPLTQAPISIAFALLGIWAIIVACRAPSSQLGAGDMSYYSLFRGLILFAWAAILILVATFDFAASFRASSETLVTRA